MFKQLDAKTDSAFYNCIDTDIDAINVEIIGPTDTETQATSLLSENLYNCISSNKIRVIQV